MSGLSPEQVIELKHALKGMAEVTRSFFVGLTEEGFSEEQAMRLTVAWLKAQSASGGGGDE